jgi:hypothetical protein
MSLAARSFPLHGIYDDTDQAKTVTWPIMNGLIMMIPMPDVS